MVGHALPAGPAAAGVKSIPGSGIDLLSLGSLVFGVVALLGYSLLTLLVGGLLISNAESVVRAVDDQISDEPVRAAGFGVAGVVAAVGTFLLTGVAVGTLVDFGAPLQVNGLLLLAILALVALVLTATAVSNIVAGSFLLRHVSDGAPNLWLALVGGSIVVSLLSLLPVVKLVGPAVAVLALGGGVGLAWDRWELPARIDIFESPPESD